MKIKISADKLLPVLEDKLHQKFSINEKGAIVYRKQADSSLVIESNEENTILAKISTIDVDRSGEVVIPEGMDAKDFQGNPVVCFGHDYSILPIAKITALQVTDKAVYAKMVFGSTDRCKEVYTLVKEGILSACSVGFVATEMLYKGTKSFDEFIQKNASRMSSTGIEKIITKWKLLENSIVTIPCNQNALVVAKGLGISDDTIKRLGITDEQIKAFDDMPMNTIKEEIVSEDKSIEVKPYPSEHAARLVDPDKFQQASFRRSNNAFGEGIDAIYGKLIGEDTMTLQTIRFDASRFTADEARQWLKDHDYSPISFEPATEDKACGDKKEEDKPCDKPIVEPKEEVPMPDNAGSTPEEAFTPSEVVPADQVSPEVIPDVVAVPETYFRVISEPVKVLAEKKIKAMQGKLF